MTANQYNECVHLWSDALFRFALKSLHQLKDDAQDIVQLAFETLWKEHEKVPIDKAKSFLFTIAYRRCMDYHRKHQKITFINSEQLNNTTSLYNQFEWKEYLQKALNQLDPTSQQLILLKDLEGYKYDEIATITQLSIEQVKVYLHRARKKLKETIQHHKNIQI